MRWSTGRWEGSGNPYMWAANWAAMHACSQAWAHRALAGGPEGVQEGPKLEPQREHAGQALAGVGVAVHHAHAVALDHIWQHLQEGFVLAQLHS
jgi:hypothetical protein